MNPIPDLTRPTRTLAPLLLGAALALTGCGQQPGGGAGGGGGGGAKAPAPSGPAAANASTAANGSTPLPAAAPATPSLPGYWYASEVEDWPGRKWSEIDVFHYMATKPSGLDSGTRYVVFYSRTCEHCEAMFNDDLAPNPDLARSVTAIEVPQEKELLTSPNAWAMPETECELLSLPLGVDWIVSTPMALRIEDGVIACAQENDHKECFGLE